MFVGRPSAGWYESASVVRRLAFPRRTLAAKRNSHSSWPAGRRPGDATENAVKGTVPVDLHLASQPYAGFVSAQPSWIRRCADLHGSAPRLRVHANTSIHGSPLGSSRSGSRSHRTCNSHSVPHRSSQRRPRRQVNDATVRTSLGARDTDEGRGSTPRYMGLTAG
jgi:hypothetical protein